MNAIIQLITGAAGSVGFGLIFHINRRYLPAAAMGGALGWLVYLLLSCSGNHIFVSMLSASFCVAVYAEILARLYGAPSTPFFVTSAIPLIPGSTLYYCMSALAEGNITQAEEYGSQTFLCALGISGGMAIAWCICDLTRKIKKSRKKVLTKAGTGANIMKLSDRDSEKHKASVERMKKIKKVVDKLLEQ